MKVRYFFYAWFVLGAFLLLGEFVFKSPAWTNPHRHFLGVNNERKSVLDGNKPELPTAVKEPKTYSMFIGKGNVNYYGIVTVKNGKDGKLKLGGGFFKEPEYDKLSLMDLKPEDKKSHYAVNIVTQEAKGLFGSKKGYQEKEEFPAELEIRAHPDTHRPTVILSPKSADAGYSITFRELKEPLEKNFLGKWVGADRKGDWSFEINQLADYQINGTAKSHWGDDEVYCHYPVFGFVTAHGKIVLLTGDSVQNVKDCNTLGWYVEKSYDNYELKEIKPSGEQPYVITVRPKTE